MKKMLNTLYVTSQKSYLFKERECVCVKHEDEVKIRIPIHTLTSIVCFGQVSCSPYLLGHCVESGVHISFLTTNGRFLARVEGEASGNILVRKEQYRQSDSEEISAQVAKMSIISKIANSRTVLKRAVRDHKDKINSDKILKTCKVLSSYIKKLHSENSLEKIRGIEGTASHLYFELFNELILNKSFNFTTRNRRPPLDNVNCLLSFVYTLLYHDAQTALYASGLDPAAGFLHRDRPGRLSLALDIMEEFRAMIADRTVLSLINLKKVSAKGFITTGSGAVRMSDKTKKIVLETYQTRKSEEISHSFLGEKVKIGMLMHIQAQLLSRYLRKDMEAYPPFIWR